MRHRQTLIIPAIIVLLTIITGYKSHGLDKTERQNKQAQVIKDRIKKQFIIDIKKDLEKDNEKVVTLFEHCRYKEAIPVAEDVLSRRNKLFGLNHIDTATSITNLGVLYKATGDYLKADRFFKMGKAIKNSLGPNHPDTATSINGLEELQDSLYDYQKAEPFYKRAVAFYEKSDPEHPQNAYFLNRLAKLYDNLREFQKAEPLYKRALEIHEKVLGPEHFITEDSLSNLANLYESIGEYQKAEFLYKKALRIMENRKGFYTKSLIYLARFYKFFGEYQKAELLYKRALELNENADNLYELAEFCRTLGDYRKAELFHKRALEIDNNKILHGGLIELYLDTGRFDKAYAMIKNADLYPSFLGRYHMLRGNYLEAVENFQQSLKSSKESGQPDFKSHTGLALSYEGLKDYPKAKKHFQEAINIIEKQWQTLPPQLKKEFMAGKEREFYRLEPYEGMIRVLFKEQGATRGTESLSIAEMVKGRLFLEMLASRQLKGRTSQDEAILTKDRQFQQAIMSLRKRVEALERNKLLQPQEVAKARGELTQKENDYSAFLEEEKLKGEESSSLFTVSTISPSTLQSYLDFDTSLLEYLTTKDKIYAWLVTQKDIKVYEIASKKEEPGFVQRIFLKIWQWIKKCLSFLQIIKEPPFSRPATYLEAKVNELLLPNISNQPRKSEPTMFYGTTEIKTTTSDKEREANRERFVNVSKDLYTLLLSPMEKDIKTPNLIIVPHGVLHKVPFSVLSDGRRYLLDKYSLTLLPSASVIEYVAAKRKASKESILVLANPQTDYVPLGFAEKEGEKVSKLFSFREVYTKEKATETLTKTKSSSFNIIHLATHGEFNDRNPLQSRLLLAKDKDNDGILQVHEIFEMDLKNANLVTLSACETALSKIQGGDDLVGLSRSFIYAGSPSLLATLWKVDDQSTAILMEKFYDNWKNKGLSKPEALRQAQIALKAIPKYSHPYYWAPFVMIGDWR